MVGVRVKCSKFNVNSGNPFKRTRKSGLRRDIPTEVLSLPKEEKALSRDSHDGGEFMDVVTGTTPEWWRGPSSEVTD